MNDLLRHERALWGWGHKLVAGVDECGRGALAGPMLAAAVVLPEGFDPLGVRDSKDMKEAQREAAYPRILAKALALSVVYLSARAIDEASEARRIDACHRELLSRAVEALHPRPTFVLVDHYRPDLEMESLSITKGETVSASIAAASIVAKVTRDRMMKDFDLLFPQWGFARHKGYGGGAGEHAKMLVKYGGSPIHRLSSEGVRRVLRDGRLDPALNEVDVPEPVLESDPDTTEAIHLMDSLAQELGLCVKQSSGARTYRARRQGPSVWILPLQRRMVFDLRTLANKHPEADVVGLGQSIAEISSRPSESDQPFVPTRDVVTKWPHIREHVMEPFFRGGGDDA